MAARAIQVTEHALTHALKSLGYYNINFRKHNGSIDVVADGNLRSIFVCVKVNADTAQVSNLSATEIEAIKGKANQVNKEPWVAHVKMDDSGKITEEIKWKNLENVG